MESTTNATEAALAKAKEVIRNGGTQAEAAAAAKEVARTILKEQHQESRSVGAANDNASATVGAVDSFGISLSGMSTNDAGYKSYRKSRGGTSKSGNHNNNNNGSSSNGSVTNLTAVKGAMLLRKTKKKLSVSSSGGNSVSSKSTTNTGLLPPLSPAKGGMFSKIRNKIKNKKKNSSSSNGSSNSSVFSDDATRDTRDEEDGRRDNMNREGHRDASVSVTSPENTQNAIRYDNVSASSPALTTLSTGGGGAVDNATAGSSLPSQDQNMDEDNRHMPSIYIKKDADVESVSVLDSRTYDPLRQDNNGASIMDILFLNHARAAVDRALFPVDTTAVVKKKDRGGVMSDIDEEVATEAAAVVHGNDVDDGDDDDDDEVGPGRATDRDRRDGGAWMSRLCCGTNNNDGDTINNDDAGGIMVNPCGAFIDDRSLCSDSYIGSQREWRSRTTTSRTSNSNASLNTNKLYVNDVERRAEIRNRFFCNRDTNGRGMMMGGNNNIDEHHHNMMRNGNNDGCIIPNNDTNDSDAVVNAEDDDGQYYSQSKRMAAENNVNGRTTPGSIVSANDTNDDDDHDDNNVKNNAPPDKSVSWADSIDLDPVLNLVRSATETTATTNDVSLIKAVARGMANGSQASYSSSVNNNGMPASSVVGNNGGGGSALRVGGARWGGVTVTSNRSNGSILSNNNNGLMNNNNGTNMYTKRMGVNNGIGRNMATSPPPASTTNDDNPNWRDMVADTVANVKIDTVENNVQHSTNINSNIFCGGNPNEQGQYHMGSAYQQPHAPSSSHPAVPAINHGQYYPSPPGTTTTTTSPRGHYQNQIMNQHVQQHQQQQQGGVLSAAPPTTAYHHNGTNDNGNHHPPFPNTHIPYQPEGPSSLHVPKLLPNNDDDNMFTINSNLSLETLEEKQDRYASGAMGRQGEPSSLVVVPEDDSVECAMVIDGEGAAGPRLHGMGAGGVGGGGGGGGGGTIGQQQPPMQYEGGHGMDGHVVAHAQQQQQSQGYHHLHQSNGQAMQQQQHANYITNNHNIMHNQGVYGHDNMERASQHFISEPNNNPSAMVAHNVIDQSNHPPPSLDNDSNMQYHYQQRNIAQQVPHPPAPPHNEYHVDDNGMNKDHGSSSNHVNDVDRPSYHRVDPNSAEYYAQTANIANNAGVSPREMASSPREPLMSPMQGYNGPSSPLPLRTFAV